MLPIAHIEKGSLLRLAAVEKSAVVLIRDVYLLNPIFKVNYHLFLRQLIFLLRLYRAYSAPFAPLLRHNKLNSNSTFRDSTDFKAIFPFSYFFQLYCSLPHEHLTLLSTSS